MTDWLHRNAQVIQSAAALVMAAAAVAAAVFVPWQIAANDRVSRGQAAREIYREFLAISIQRPELSARTYCALTSPVERAAYESYVDYLLYTAEQVMDLDPADWSSVILARLSAHEDYLCTFGPDDLAALTPDVHLLIGDLTERCDNAPSCPRVGQ